MSKKKIVFPLFGYDYFSNTIHQSLGYEIGKITIHQFPDEEIMVKIDSPIKGSEVILIASLDKPNIKLAPLLFAAKTAKELGATKIGLIAPYLAYMRQDKQFHPGEGITSKYFAKLISDSFDWLITIDPHLHRWRSLNDIYSIPCATLHTAPYIASWIKNNVVNPILIGPDMESSQWASEIAKEIDAPFLILEKTRKGDQSVEISIPKIATYQNHTPVLVDDIISTAATMIETVNLLKSFKLKPPVCVGIHAIFSGNAYDNLLNSGVDKIVSCNTVLHLSNGIDVSESIIKAVTSR